MFCKACGRKIDDDSEFCTYCGSPVEKKTETLEIVSEKKQRKTGVAFITAASVVAVAVVSVVAVGFFLKTKASKEVTEEITVGEKLEELKREEEEKKVAEAVPEEIMEVFPESSPETSGEKIKETPGEELDRKMESMQSEKSSAEQSEPEETKASLITDEPDVSKLHKANVIAANASSTISQEGTSNSPILLFDGKDATNWQEGADGYGISETISFSFDDFYKVKYIGFKLGNWKTDRYYVGNAKPKTKTLAFGDYVGPVTFTGERKVEWVEVNKAVKANSMRVTIDDVYPGTQWEDTCITEIMVYGE